MTEESTEFCIVEDDSGHTYVCPLDQRGEARRILESVGEYWERGWLVQGTTEPLIPEWMVQIDGPHRLIFTGWRVG